MSKTNVVNFINKNKLEVFKEMEGLIVEYYIFYAAELGETGYSNADILNDKNGAMSAMNTVTDQILRSVYGNQMTEEFYDYQIEFTHVTA